MIAFLIALIAWLQALTPLAAPAPAAPVAAHHAAAPVHHGAAARTTPAARLCPDGTNAIPVGPSGKLGCPGPAAQPGPVGVPPGFTAVPDPADIYPAPSTDPCFRQDPECYTVPR